MNSSRSQRPKTIRGWYNYYKEKGFVRYVGINAVKIVLAYTLFVLLIYLIGKYLIDYERIFSYFTKSVKDSFVLVLFFISESFLGLVPVDLFVLWSVKHASPLFFLAILGVLSYIGGIISYGIGIWFATRPRMKDYSERKLQTYISFVRKWGGAFIIIAALFPFTPFSMVTIAVSLLRYPFRSFVLFALTRLVRFVIQGIIFFNVLNIDTWIL
jgi:membrane protein YqaA with SNARE-associated domain